MLLLLALAANVLAISVLWKVEAKKIIRQNTVQKKSVRWETGGGL